MNIVQPLSRSKSPTGNRSLHTIDESHLQSLSVDMEGGDYLELENIFGDGSVPIDLELDDLGWGLPQTAPSEGDTTFDKPNELTNVLEDYPMDDFVNMEPPVQEGPQSPVDAASKQTPERVPFRASNNEGKNSQEPQASRPILASLMDPVNIPLSSDAIEQVEFYPLENTSLESSNLDDNGGGIVQAASIAVKSKRGKKQVRVLLDARTELTDKELREARDNYLQEQSRLRHEMEQQRLQKTVVERANELLYGPPDIRMHLCALHSRKLIWNVVEAEPLRQLWSNALVALIETKTGLITLVKPPRKKRPAKRRRLNGSDEHVRQVVREGIEEDEGTRMDVDEVGYQAEFFGGDISMSVSHCSNFSHTYEHLDTEVNTGGPEFDIRSSEVGVTLSVCAS
ncbi:hypothetical protein FS842_000686 [Serendipita sp. 407]|nr:hypothetical protein FS842_000686 [Serendipita sp. 407]